MLGSGGSHLSRGGVAKAPLFCAYSVLVVVLFWMPAPNAVSLRWEQSVVFLLFICAWQIDCKYSVVDSRACKSITHTRAETQY